MQGKSEPSPLTRGTRIFGFQSCLNIRFIPAYAGNSGLRPAFLKSPTVHPRLRGELVYLNVMAGVPNGSSPLTRGTHDLSDAIAIFGRFIPAYAGNSAFLSVLASVNAVHPRLRGELRLVRGPLRWSSGSSPLTRGTLKQFLQTTSDTTVHPRLRGELSVDWGILLNKIGSSPLTRGTHVLNDTTISPVRFIPAYAGNSALARQNAAQVAVHPRLRGELT